MDKNFDQIIRGSYYIVYNWIVAVHKVSNNTIDGYNGKYSSIKCPQNFLTSLSVQIKSHFTLAIQWY